MTHSIHSRVRSPFPVRLNCFSLRAVKLSDRLNLDFQTPQFEDETKCLTSGRCPLNGIQKT